MLLTVGTLVDRRGATHDLRVAVGTALREERLTAGLSQVQAAARSGVSLRQLVKIERGANTTLDTIAALAATYGARPLFALEREP